jgi:3'-5' exoribonuclease
MTKKVFIEDLRAGDVVDDVFVLVEKNMAQKRNGENFLTVTLADRTGRIKGVVWDQVDTINQGSESGDFVFTKGNVSEYKGLLQLVVKGLERCPAGTVEPVDFLPVTTRDVDKMFSRLTEVTATLRDPHLKKLFEMFWADPEFTAAFKTAPAAKKMHHAYLGGLLEHTLSMTLLADIVAGHYGGVDRDMLIAGAILHDVGKVKEFEYSTKIDYTDAGRLVSHIVIAVEMLNEKIGRIEGFPEEHARLLKHMIISHHGAREFGSPEPPKTIEAVLLHYIDEIDSKVNGIREFMASTNTGESWTAYHRLLERHFYKGSSKLKAES